MGLGISLYPKAAQEADDAREKAWDELYESGRWDAMTDDEKKAWRAEHPYGFEDRDKPSEKYPEHLFNRRYLRSSYNAGGFNSAVPDLTGTDHGLYWVFEPMGREWDGGSGWLSEADLPLLAECRKRADTVVQELRDSDRLRTTTVSGNTFLGTPTVRDRAAMALYRAEAAKERGPLGWGYSNQHGTFWGPDEPREVLAAIPGVDVLGSPGVHLIYRADDESLDHYAQAAEITGEFIDEAIALIKADGAAYISWSG